MQWMSSSTDDKRDSGFALADESRVEQHELSLVRVTTTTTTSTTTTTTTTTARATLLWTHGEGEARVSFRALVELGQITHRRCSVRLRQSQSAFFPDFGAF